MRGTGRIETPSGLDWTSTSLGEPSVRQASTETALSPQAVNALCAIANPEGYFRTLKDLGFSFLSQQALPDHSARIEEVCRALLSENDGPVVVTEKDAMRLPADLLQHARVNVLRVRLQVESAEKLLQKIDQAISVKRKSQ